jgi:hypothetical protein
MKPLRLLVALSLLATSSMMAQIRGGFTTAGTLPAVDDDYTGPVIIPFQTNFFGTTFNSVFISTNGYITFGSGKVDYTPEGLRGNLSRIIAPFFADVDNRGVGTITYGTGTVNGLQAFAVNWTGVGFYDRRITKRNTFQLVLISRGDTGLNNFDIEFNYGSIQWEAGDVDNGSNGSCTIAVCGPAVGYSNGLAGTANVSFELAGSHVRGAFIDGGPNSLQSVGRLTYPVRAGVVQNNPAITACPAGTATVGTSYSSALSATGGVTPYTWAVATGTLPGGLTLNTSSGLVAGTPAGAGTFNFTVRVSGGAGSSAGSSTRDCSIVVSTGTVTPPPPTIPTMTLGVSQSTSGPVTVSLTAGSAATSAITGVLTLGFTADSTVSGWPAGTNNVQLLFTNGTKTTTFTIPQGSTTGTISNGVFSPGTVAGIISLTITQVNGAAVSLAPFNAQIFPAVPLIVPGSVRIISTATGIAVELDAFANTRDLTSVTLVFQAASGATLNGGSPGPISLSSASQTWFASTDGRGAGGAFRLNIPFPYTGDVTALGSVTATLTSSRGPSTAVSGGR